MIKKYKDIIREYKKIRKNVKDITKSTFKNKLKLIELQERLLLEYVINSHLWVPEGNDNQFFFLVNLYHDAVQSERRVKELIIEGDYNAAGTLLRNIFETMLLIEHLGKYASDWREWLEFQDLQEIEREKPLQKKSKRLRQLGLKFSIKRLIENRDEISVKENYKWTYGYFCSFSHTSMERLRRRTDAAEGVGFTIYYVPEFNTKIVNYYLNSLFTMIDAINTDFNSAFKPIKLPLILKKYNKVKELFKE